MSAMALVRPRSAARGFMVAPSDSWKIVLAIALAAAIVTSAYAPAPRRRARRAELWRLAASALMLYAIGVLALLRERPTIAAGAYAAGIATCAYAGWRARGTDSDDDSGGGSDPTEGPPPPDPDGLPRIDWNDFERAFRAYAERASRTRAPVS
jgi:hypothetical protein